MSETKIEWSKGERPGQVKLNSPEFDISYVPYYDTSWDVPEGGETAIIVQDKIPGKYFILNGDWRLDYEKLWPSLDKCMQFWREHKEYHSDFSAYEE